MIALYRRLEHWARSFAEALLGGNSSSPATTDATHSEGRSAGPETGPQPRRDRSSSRPGAAISDPFRVDL